MCYLSVESTMLIGSVVLTSIARRSGSGAIRWVGPLWVSSGLMFLAAFELQSGELLDAVQIRFPRVNQR